MPWWVREQGSVQSPRTNGMQGTIKAETPNNILKIDDPPNFQIQVANGQLKKPTATATLEFKLKTILSLNTSS